MMMMMLRRNTTTDGRRCYRRQAGDAAAITAAPAYSQQLRAALEPRERRPPSWFRRRVFQFRIRLRHDILPENFHMEAQVPESVVEFFRQGGVKNRKSGVVVVQARVHVNVAV